MQVIRTGEGGRGCTRPEIPDDESWTVTEFTDLGDAHRTQRLVEFATVFSQRPSASLPQACGHWARRRATVSLLWCLVRRCPPTHRPAEHLPPVAA